MTRAPHVKGLVLLVAVGILTLLSITALALARMAVQLGERTALSVDRAAARLLARGGIEYARARLRRNPADDWTCGDEPGTPLEKLMNPSYAHSEPYTDLYPPGAGNGRFDAGSEPYVDANGNGGFDARTGRLRGSRAGAGDGSFALKILGTGISVNDGMLEPSDRNANGVLDACDRPLVWKQNDPDTRTLDFEPGVKNGRVAHAIDLLGQSLSTTNLTLVSAAGTWNEMAQAVASIFTDPSRLPAGTSTLDMAGAPDPFGPLRIQDYSPLMEAGRAIVGNRPVGGYRDSRQLRRAIPPGTWEKVGDFLVIGAERAGTCRTRFYRDAGRERQGNDQWPRVSGPRQYRLSQTPPWAYAEGEKVSPIHMNGAARPLLQALFTGLAAYSLPPGTLYTLKTMVCIGFEEAGRVADFLIANRPFLSRYDLFRRLDAAKDRLFPRDTVWDQCAKADLVAANADLDPTWDPNETILSYQRAPLPASFPGFSWGSYDLPRVLWPSGERRLERRDVSTHWFLLPVPAEVPTVNEFAFGLSAGLFASVYPPYRQGEPPPEAGWGDVRQPRYGTLPLSLEPPGTFQARCLGRSCGATIAMEGAVRISRSVSAASQADFENLSGHDRTRDEAPRAGRPYRKDRVQTYPRFPLDSCADLAAYPEPVKSTGETFPPAYVFPEDYGTITLMARADPGRGEDGLFFCQPCWEIGQPLRDDPEPTLLRNFRNAVDSEPKPQVLMRPYAATFQDTTDEVLAPFSVPPEAVLNLPPSPTFTPSTLGFRWQARFPWFNAQGELRGGTVDFWGEQCAAMLDFGASQYTQLRTRDVSNIIEANLKYTPATTLPVEDKVARLLPDKRFIFGITTGATGMAGAAEAAVSPRRDDLKGSVFFYENKGAAGDEFFWGVELNSIRNYSSGSFHRIVFVIAAEQGPDAALVVAGSVDGIADPGLREETEHFPLDPTSDAMLHAFQDVYRGFSAFAAGAYTSPQSRRTGTRLYSRAMAPGEILAKSQSQPFYWDSGDYVSPLRILSRSEPFLRIRWEGFVPAAIAGAIGPGNAPPLQVELWAYPNSAGRGEPRVFKLPPQAWRNGGGGFAVESLLAAGEKPPEFRSFRFRVRMDSSAVDGFNNETPVFDSFSISHRRDRLLSLSEMD